MTEKEFAQYETMLKRQDEELQRQQHEELIKQQEERAIWLATDHY